MRTPSLGEAINAALIALIAIAGTQAISSGGVSMLIGIASLFIALALIIILFPRLWGGIRALIRSDSQLNAGLYIELYRRSGVAYISVFRHVYDWRHGRMEIYGAPYEIKVEDGKRKPWQPSLSDWHSHSIDFDGNLTGRSSAFYFYYPTNDAAITGITRMYIDKSKESGDGFFSDIRSSNSNLKVIPFKYFAVHMNKAHKAPANEELWRKLKALHARCVRGRGGEAKFRDLYSKEMAEAILACDNRVDFLFSSTSAAALRHELEQLVAYASPPEVNFDDAVTLKELGERVIRAYSKYSDFSVAAAVVDETGAIHYGANVENASYPLGTCAEQAAIAAMVSAGGSRIKRVFLTSGANRPVLPCGGCRQRIAELASPDCEICLVEDGAVTSREPFSALLPHPFSF